MKTKSTTSQIDINSIVSDTKSMSALCHLLGLLTSFIGPLIMLVLFKRKSQEVESAAMESLNFQITMVIAWAISGALVIVLIGFLAMPILGIIHFLFPVIATIRSLNGQPYKYPINLNLVK